MQFGELRDAKLGYTIHARQQLNFTLHPAAPREISSLGFSHTSLPARDPPRAAIKQERDE